MPRANAKTATATPAQVLLLGGAAAAAAAEEESPLTGSPLFSLGEGAEVAKIGVIRDEPIDEGQVGYLPPDATEDDIRRRWGGGVYRLQAKTERGHHIKNGFRTVHISGEPKFHDQVAEAKYARLRRQELGQREPETDKRPEFSVLDLLQLQHRQAEMDRQRAREDYDRREAEREAAHRREMERLRLDAEARERERRADDERRERDRHADELRRQKEQEEGRGRDREFFAAMLKMSREEQRSGGIAGIEQAIKLILASKEMFGGEGPDAVTALMQNIPAILDRSSGIAAQIAGQQPPAPAAEPPAIQQSAEKEDLTISGEHARALQEAIDNLQAQGIDPGKALLWQFRQLAQARRQQPQQPAAAGDPAANVSESDGKQTEPAQASPAPSRARQRQRARRR